MFKPGRFNGTLAFLSLAVCFFLGAFPELEAVAQPCNEIGQSVPGEVVLPEDFLPTITNPEQEFPRPFTGCTSYSFSTLGGSPPYKVVAITYKEPGISGSGVEIDPSKTDSILICSDSCGSFTVTVADSMGHEAKKVARVTGAGAGHWTEPEIIGCINCGVLGADGCYAGDTSYRYYWTMPDICPECATLSNPCWETYPLRKIYRIDVKHYVCN